MALRLFPSPDGRRRGLPDGVVGPAPSRTRRRPLGSRGDQARRLPLGGVRLRAERTSVRGRKVGRLVGGGGPGRPCSVAPAPSGGPVPGYGRHFSTGGSLRPPAARQEGRIPSQ